MLTLASDFWPLFWAILATGAVLTIALSLLVNTVPLSRHHRPSASVTQHPAAQALRGVTAWPRDGHAGRLADRLLASTKRDLMARSAVSSAAPGSVRAGDRGALFARTGW